MKKKLIYLSLIILSSATFFIYSCSSKSGVAPVVQPPTPVANAVSIKNFAFSPASITVKAGTTVTWTNSDTAPHTVTDLNQAFDSGNIASGKTYKFKFATAGTYTYHCLIHSMMANATVVVTN